jgi:hypothetical protein
MDKTNNFERAVLPLACSRGPFIPGLARENEDLERDTTKTGSRGGFRAIQLELARAIAPVKARAPIQQGFSRF